MAKNSIASSAGAQRKRVGRKPVKDNFGSLARDIARGFRFFENNRVVVARIGRPKKEKS